MANIVRGSLRSSLRYQHFENHHYHDSSALIDLKNVKLGTTDNIKIFICRWVSLTIGLGCFSDLKIKNDDAGPKLNFILSAIIVSWIAITYVFMIRKSSVRNFLVKILFQFIYNCRSLFTKEGFQNDVFKV